MHLLTKILGGRPMKRMQFSFTDKVSGRPVYEFKDRLGRYWLAEHSWALFRVELPKAMVTYHNAFFSTETRP